MAGRSLFVVALQTAGIANDPAGTLEQLEQRVRSARSLFDGVQLVLAPELHLMALPGLLDESDGAMQERAVEIPGPLTERLGALAKETGVWLVPGSVWERTDEGIYNTAVVFSPQGELVTSYRKCFPWQPYETSRPGRSVVSFDIEGIGKLGLAICHDGVFPEVFRQLAWDGAEAILQVVLTGTSDRDAEVVVARANAIVNQVHIVNVNAASPVGNGRSVVIDPEGSVRYEAGSGEEVLTTVLDFDAVRLVRERGAFGMNKLWEQLDRHGAELELPMYGGRYQPRPK
ncbi:MAG: carbon-nitrogen hydrolase family protein [Gaiellaceae bacterium]